MITLVGKFKDVKGLLEEMVRTGYGQLPVVWGIKLYLSRN